jgi:hypothetical protein
VHTFIFIFQIGRNTCIFLGFSFFFFLFFLVKNNSLYKLSSVFQNAPEVSMDLIVQLFVIHATLLYVNDLKEIVQMAVLKATQDTSVFSQVFEI